jgi:hypothetical protein
VSRVEASMHGSSAAVNRCGTAHSTDCCRVGRSGHFTCAFVVDEFGIGKTHILHGLAGDAAAEGVIVREVLSCGTDTRNYSPIREASRNALSSGTERAIGAGSRLPISSGLLASYAGAWHCVVCQACGTSPPARARTVRRCCSDETLPAAGCRPPAKIAVGVARHPLHAPTGTCRKGQEAVL